MYQEDLDEWFGSLSQVMRENYYNLVGQAYTEMANLNQNEDDSYLQGTMNLIQGRDD